MSLKINAMKGASRILQVEQLILVKIIKGELIQITYKIVFSSIIYLNVIIILRSNMYAKMQNIKYLTTS